MLIKNDSLYLYNLTLKPPGLSVGSTVGQFAGNRKTQEIVIAYPGRIELWVADPNNGKLKKHFSEEVFGCIQSIDKVRAVGSQKDLLVIASDSGKLSVAEWKDEAQQFIPLYQEPHSKTGMRRTTPGEYLCVDPQNRAILLGAIEANKIVYRSQTNDKGLFQVSSPIESIVRHNLTLTMCALDTGYENPVFAAIECSYDEQNKSRLPLALDLNYYELDQGLNHLVKRKADNIPLSSIHLIPLPGYIGGIFICCESFLIYDHPYKQRLYLPLPIRTLTSKSVILDHVVHRIRKNDFFILLQSHLGDCFKITVNYDIDDENINNISISYFDTIPLATSLNILKSGFLFADTISGNKLFYQFESLGDGDICLDSNSFPTLESASVFDITDRFFQPTGLQNLALVDVVEALNPLTGSAIVESITSESLDPLKQVLLSSNSHLKTLTRALPVSIIASSQLPMSATHIFASKLFRDSKNDEYLVLSSTTQSQTLVLSIGEVVEEVSDSEYIMDQPTIDVQQVGKSSTIQIYLSGIRHVRQINENGSIRKRTTDWYTPAGISIVAASANNEQVVIGLSNREVCYFEIDVRDDQLIEYQERLEIPSGSITAVAIADSSKSKQKVKRSNYAVVGCSDDTIQIISLRRENCLEIVSMQALSSRCSSLAIVPLGAAMFIHIGMANGLYVRVSIDEITGKISDTQVKFLGSREVSVFPLGLSYSDLCGVLCISSRPWLCLPAKDSYDLIPLMNSSISCGTSFYSDNLGFDVVVGIENDALTIFTIGNYGSELSDFMSSQNFHTQTIRLRHLPRKLIVKESSVPSVPRKFAYVVQCDRGIESPFPTSQFAENCVPYTEECAVDQDYYEAFGYKRDPASWASCLQVINFNTQEIIQTVQFEKDECVSNVVCVKFDSSLLRASENLVVSIKKGENASSSTNPLRNFLYTFKVNAAAERDSSKDHLSFLHRTEVDLPTGDMIPFEGKLLVSMGNYLRLYDFGQRQLLRKSSSNIDHLVNIVKLTDQGGGRIVVGDSTLSTTFAQFDELENKFVPFADDIMKRHLTAVCALDHDTIIGGDKFGNVFVSRLPEFLSKEVDNNWCLTKYQDSYLNGSGNRIKNICEFYLQDIPTSFAKGSLVVGGRESIIYSGIQGTLGILIPLSSLSEVKFFNELQIVLREYFNYNFDDFDKENMGYNLIGKDHLKFRSYYNPVKNILDGDLIDRFFYLSTNSKSKVASKLGRTSKEIERKISDIKNRSAF